LINPFQYLKITDKKIIVSTNSSFVRKWPKQVSSYNLGQKIKNFAFSSPNVFIDPVFADFKSIYIIKVLVPPKMSRPLSSK
jgi:hypothetical protein